MIKYIFIVLLGITALNAQDTIREYYPSGKISGSFLLESGVREGVSVLYYESGKIKAEVPYVAGKIDGMMKVYNEKGTLKELINFENGKREGTFTRFDENGKFLEELFYVNGRIEKDTLAGTLPAGNEQEMQVSFFSGADTSFYSFADAKPEPIGGWAAFMGKLRIPDSVRTTGSLSGYVFLLPGGEVLKTEVLSGITPAIDSIIIRALASALFTPPVLNGERIKYKMPVEIKITGY